MTRGERAQQIWQVLTGAANNRQVITYSILADLIGTGAGTLAPLLGAVMNYCVQAGLPPLTVLVVNKETGLPGSGLSTVEEIGRDREKVFNTRWHTLIPPAAAAFELAAKKAIRNHVSPGVDGTLGPSPEAINETTQEAADSLI